jgi:hypothetical protein
MLWSEDPAQANRMIALLADGLRRSDARQNGRTVALTGVFRMDAGDRPVSIAAGLPGKDTNVTKAGANS